MTDRDRQIELLKNCIEENIGVDDPNARFEVDYENIVDCLLANGVIVPPCKVRKTVYCLIEGFENPLKAIVNRITVQVLGVVISCSVLGYFGQSYMATDFGKTLFLTKEEAEQALKEREGK